MKESMYIVEIDMVTVVSSPTATLLTLKFDKATWPFSFIEICDIRPHLKKSLFPVQRVATIVTSRPAAISIGFSFSFFLVRKQ